MFGGNFTGRVNMNLREDKGYTYGARCGISTRHGPGQFGCGGNFRTDVTGLSLAELRREFNEVIGERPLTDEEVATARDNLAFGWPGAFETTGTLLDLEFEIWRYGKSEDWASQYIPNVRAVTTEQANAALKKWLVPERTFWLVVGDKSVILEGLQASGLPIVELNRNGEEI